MRLLRPTEFSRVYDTRQSASAGPLVLYAAVHRGNPAGVRVGLSVSRRIGSAVVRNRWKRRLREAFREVRGSLPCGNDFVIVVRSGEPPAGEAGAREMKTAIAALAARVVGRRGYAQAMPRPRDDAAAKPKRRR
ncbi:MAG: ribonuclease P protein component [Planctomycetes bacterium]|nr:ribonuclease P protein component [Planctomycetota bacterium]